MVDYVELYPADREIIIEASQYIINWKHHSLQKHNWLLFESDYLPRLVEAINTNRWKVVNRSNNIFTWYIDQLRWCRIPKKGVAHRDCPYFIDTDLGQMALEIAETAARGIVSYRTHRSFVENITI